MKTKSPIKIYNTLTGKKDLLKPLKNKKVNLFVCGPTVYDFSHIGHARTYIIFDCFVKYLQHAGFTVFYLQNITDVDDKIIQRAREKGVSAEHLAEAFFQEHLKDMKNLHITTVNKYAKATDYIKEIISQVERLQKKGFAYTLDDGIYFDISKVKHYGKLSHRTALQAEDSVSRIDYSKNKKNRGDFCLWKFVPTAPRILDKIGTIEGEPQWPAPFGAGRPGWHIEDTAITETFFGAQYDIHGGARDLIFPHHEAEITQMESLSDKKPMAKYWMHTGFLTVDSQKMSKSLGNGTSIDNFLQRYPVQHLRFWIAKNLWHSPVDYSESVMIEVKMALEKIEEFLRKITNYKLPSLDSLSRRGGQTTNKSKLPKSKIQNLLKGGKENFYKNLADDFNTPKAFAVLFELIKNVNKLMGESALDKKTAKEIYEFFEEINEIFDIIDFKKLKTSNVPKEVTELVKARENYRKEKEWQKADEARKEIAKYGYTVDDTKDGTVLKKN